MPLIAGASMTWMPSDAVAKYSVWEKKRRFGDVRVPSALPLKADILRKRRHVSKVPRAEVPFLPVTRIISEAQGSYPMGRFALSLCCRDRISAQRA
jgi:hypothetical protein